MAISGSQKAYTIARSGLARSGATRSNFVPPWVSVELIGRDDFGNITGRVELIPYIRYGSLQVTQALNDEADTCSFQIVPTAPANAVPVVGQEVWVSWTPGNPLFRGYALVVQFDRRPMNEPPFVAVQCQDAMWRFDARIVTYRFPAQSVSTSIAYLLEWFCTDPAPPPITFTTTYVQPNMPSLPSFDIINERPSTVMRRLTAAVQGAFYVDGRDVHAWAGSVTEPASSNPQPLTNTLATLKSFRLTEDATQLRKRVLVEGRRASTVIGYPSMPDATDSLFLGVPVTDATIFPATGPDAKFLARIGSQWMYVQYPVIVAPASANPPQARTAAPFTPGQITLQLHAVTVAPPAAGWIRIAGQLTRYDTIIGNPTAGDWQISLPIPSRPYGVLTVPVPAEEPVEWVDSVIQYQPHGLRWDESGNPTPGDPAVRTQPVDTPVVTLAEGHRPVDGWPPLEAFVQDGRYSYAGAQDRANDDLEAFSEPLVTAEWDTDDLNAAPGRIQTIGLSRSDVAARRMPASVTITRAEITFPLRTEPPRRRCTGGAIKSSTFLDLVLTDES